MQANTNSRFIKNVMLGLVASSAGAFVALPGAAMPETSEAGTVEAAPVEAIEAVPAPVAEDTLPMPAAADAVEADAVDTDVVTEADALEEEPVAEEAMVEEEPVAEEAMTEEEPVAEEAMTEEEPVAETEAAPVNAETVEAADIEALDEEAIEASDAMDGEPVVEEPMAEEEPVVEEPTVEEAPVAEEEPTEPVAEGEEINTEDFTIAELTDSSDSFNTLAAALAAADLTEILGGEGPYTVFAPTDEAFEALPEGAVDQLLLPENKDVLVQVLTYHVVPGAIMSADLEPGAVATVEGSELTVDIAETVTVNNANVVLADVEASNGVIHIIDRVIIPPSPEAEAPSEDIAIQDEPTAEVEADAE
ncbi:MAG: fasciclin domain-containing protein [Cyanobacteria bacterium J06623_5]